MYGIFIRYPRYDNRDAFVGYSVERYHANAYETLRCAWAMVPRHEDDGGDESSFFVASLLDPYRRTQPLPVSIDSPEFRRFMTMEDDIPF